MPSNTERGRKFQEQCKRILEATLGKEFSSEVQIALPNGQTHRFDLVNPEKDIVVECKAYTWTEGGNVPSAKITHLRESLNSLNSIPGSVFRHLIISKSSSPGRRETLGEYFVRLNRPLLGKVNIFELIEETQELHCLHGGFDRIGIVQPPPGPDNRAVLISVDALGRLRRCLFNILDQAEGLRSRNEGPAKRVTRLRSGGKVPRNIANCMHSILGFRDVAEYEAHSLTGAESTAVRGAWEAIVE